MGIDGLAAGVIVPVKDDVKAAMSIVAVALFERGLGGGIGRWRCDQGGGGVASLYLFIFAII